jgi:hypothetical protein
LNRLPAFIIDVVVGMGQRTCVVHHVHSDGDALASWWQLPCPSVIGLSASGDHKVRGIREDAAAMALASSSGVRREVPTRITKLRSSMVPKHSKLVLLRVSNIC